MKYERKTKISKYTFFIGEIKVISKNVYIKKCLKHQVNITYNIYFTKLTNLVALKRAWL